MGDKAEEAVLPPLRLKSAVTGLSEYFNERTYSKFSKISSYFLKKDEAKLGFSHADISPLNLAKLTSELIRFMDTNFGRKEIRTSRKVTKIPIRLFQDYSPNGSLQLILMTVLRQAKGLRKLDLSQPKRRDEYILMFIHIDSELRRKGFLLPIKVCPVEGCNRKAVETSARRLCFSMASISKATHLIYPDPPGTTTEDTQGMEYCRTLTVKESMALVHWWYYPDSYDSWIPAAEVQGETEEDEEHSGPWHVQLRWLQDSDYFNELMNETDYEIPEENWIEVPAPPPQVVAHSLMATKRPLVEDVPVDQQDRKELSNDLEPPQKESRMAIDTVEEPKTVTGIKIRVKLPKAEVPQVPEEPTKPPSEPASESSEEEGPMETLSAHPHPIVDLVQGAELIPEAYVPRVCNVSQAIPLRLQPPSSSSKAASGSNSSAFVCPSAPWFSLDSIHRIEKRALPDFFSGRFALKTPRLYKQIRDKMVESYRESPMRYISPSAVKVEVDTDLYTVVCIHSFLERWGIINNGPRVDLQLGVPTSTNHPTHFSPKIGVATSKSSLTESQLKPSSSLGSGAEATRCFSCKSEISSHSMRCTASHVEIAVCAKCFATGKFPNALSSRDFRPFTGSDAGADWKGNEVSLLLEGIQLFQDDWEKVADHVGSKDAAACLTYFVRMPIEDSLMEAAKSRRNSSGNSVDEIDLPFRKSKNPLMSQIAFLAAHVSTDVAAAGARAALTTQMQAFAKKKENMKGASVGVEDLCRISLQESARRAMQLAEVEGRDAERFQAMATETRLRELDLKLKRLDAVEDYLRNTLNAK